MHRNAHPRRRRERRALPPAPAAPSPPLRTSDPLHCCPSQSRARRPDLPALSPASSPADRPGAVRSLALIPFTLLIIFVLIYINTRSATKTIIVMLAVPFSLVGAFWMLYLLHFNMSVAVWVGLIALAGLDAETGVVMLLYLDQAWEKFVTQGRMRSLSDLYEAVKEGAVQRIRPKIMTVSATSLWSASHHVVAGHPGWRGCNEANCYANDWWSDYFCNSRVPNLSCDLRIVARALIGWRSLALQPAAQIS